MQAIVAVDQNWAIGQDGDQLCYLPPDLKRFQRRTTGHPILLGRKTLATFPGGRPLKNRRNLILSRNPAFAPEGGEVFSALDEALATAPADTFVIGSPLYWHNICGSVRNMLDRFYGKIKKGELFGRKLYFVFQGAAPEQWMLEAGEYTMKRFAAHYGLSYGGMMTNRDEAAKLTKTV